MITTFGGLYTLADLKVHAAVINGIPSGENQSDADVTESNQVAGLALSDLIDEIERLKRFEPAPESLTTSEELEELFSDFSRALLQKAIATNEKRGLTDEWKQDDWRDQLNLQLTHHIAKGDPRDPAIYCAFAWYHGWSVDLAGLDSLPKPKSFETSPGTPSAQVTNVNEQTPYESLEKQVLQWSSSDNTGLSSMCIALTATGVECEPDHPLGLDDFNRCLLLLETIPELRTTLKHMGKVSPTWLALTERWDEIEAKAVAELGWAPRTGFIKPLSTAKLSSRALAECLRKGTEIQNSLDAEIDRSLFAYDQTN